MESNAAEATTKTETPGQAAAQEATTPGSSAQKAQRAPKNRQRTKGNKNAGAAASNEDVGQAAGAEPVENGDDAGTSNKRQPRNRRNGRANDGAGEERKARDFKNVFGDAIIEPEQIRDTVIDKAASVFVEPQALHELLQGRSNFAKLVRVHERVCEINDKYGVMDFSLKAKSRHSKDIDNAYFSARNDHSIWQNVRDGNTLLLEYNPDEDNRLANVTFLRQGLPKFFTLTADSVSEAKRAIQPRDSEQVYYQYDTLAQVRKALMQGAQVEVHRSLKTNGDGAHVTWSAALKAWVVTSQNVSIVARNEKDVKTLYPEQTRYFLARKIALCWMRKLKAIEKDAGKMEELKRQLTDHVFIGDFIGNTELINLIKYPRETISFHSVMKKVRMAQNAKDTTYCVPDSFSILKRFPIDVVPNRICGVYESYDELCTSLAEIHKQVANSSLFTSEEGAVLTFIRRNAEGSSEADSVISMCKVKSVEYQALKLMVDLLQGAVEAGNLERQQDNLFTLFVKDFKIFSRNIDETLDSHPETFYIDLFSTAYTMIAKKSSKDKEMYQDLLYSDTVKFMVLVLKTNEEKHGGKRYVGQIDLESQNLSDSSPGGEEVVRPRAKKTATITSTPDKILGETFSQESKKSKQATAKTAKPEAAANATPVEESKKKGRGVKSAQAKTATSAQEQQPTKPTPRSSSMNPNVTALVVPPYSLKKALMNSIKETYQVIESATLNVAVVEEAMKKRKSKSQQILVVLSSLDDITEQSSLCNLKLFAYKCTDAYKGEPASNFYLDEKDSFYAHSSFKNATTAKLIRQETEKMIKVANSSNLIKLVNPARMHLSSEEDLMVVLELQDPPSLNVSVDQGEQEGQQQETPGRSLSPVKATATAAPKKSATQAATSKKTQSQKKSIKRQETPQPSSMKGLALETVSAEGAKQSQIVVVFPIGIPGMGKTHFAESTLQDVFQELDLDVGSNLHVIQNDQIRKKCLDKYLKQNPRKSKQEGVKATATESINMFKNELNQTLLALSKNTSGDLQMIYLDKNYPPAEIKITLEAINEHAANKNAQIRRVALVPHILQNIDCPDFPFSTNFLVQCFIRCLERENHLTIQNDDPERLAKILVLFFQQFKGTHFNENFTEELGFDSLIPVRFTMEHEDLELPPKLNEALLKAVNSQSVSELDDHISEVVRLINLYRSLFGGSNSPMCTRENEKLLQKSLLAFTDDFKKAASAAAQKVSKQQNAITQPELAKDAIEEESDDEDSFEMATAAEPMKKAKTVQPAKKTAQATADLVKKPKMGHDEFMQEFVQQQTRSQKKQTKPKAAATVTPKAVAPPISTYTPKGGLQNKARADDGFETVGAQKTIAGKRRFSDSDDSESDDIRTPNTLLVKLAPNRQELNMQLIEAIEQVPESSMNSILTDNIQAIKELLTKKDCLMRGGWEHPSELNLVCMQVSRDEDIFEESQIAQDFVNDKAVTVSSGAILFIPGKAVIAIASVDDQDVDEKVPFVTLLSNDFKHKNQITSFVRSATQGRGPFASQIQTLRTGGKINEKQKFKSATVQMGRDMPPVIAHLITLDDPIEMPGRTFIQY